MFVEPSPEREKKCVWRQFILFNRGISAGNSLYLIMEYLDAGHVEEVIHIIGCLATLHLLVVAAAACADELLLEAVPPAVRRHGVLLTDGLLDAAHLGASG